MLTYEAMNNNQTMEEEERFKVISCTGKKPWSVVVVEQVTSVAGTEVKMLTVKRVDEKWTRIVHVTYDKSGMPKEKHVTFKFKWDMERLTHEFDKNGEISFKYMVTDRCKQHLTTRSVLPSQYL
jgi:hypothetical protein